jgi:AcrR family transcriptional regulator
MSVTPLPHPPGTKRERTRNKLLVATQQLLSERSAGSLGIRDVSQKAGVSHPTFYNYFDSIEALLDNLTLLFAFTHAMHMEQVTRGRTHIGEIFSISTRQTLRFMAESPAYGHYLFDAGMRIDHFIGGMRAQLCDDLIRGMDTGVFAIRDLNLTLAQVTGALLGVSLAVYRNELDAHAIEPATANLLVMLGVAPEQAEQLARVDAPFCAPPPLPLQWPIST